MRRYPSLPLRGFKRPVRDASDRVTRPADETTHQSHALELLGGHCSNGHQRRLELWLLSESCTCTCASQIIN